MNDTERKCQFYAYALIITDASGCISINATQKYLVSLLAWVMNTAKLLRPCPETSEPSCCFFVISVWVHFQRPPTLPLPWPFLLHWHKRNIVRSIMNSCSPHRNEWQVWLWGQKEEAVILLFLPRHSMLISYISASCCGKRVRAATFSFPAYICVTVAMWCVCIVNAKQLFAMLCFFFLGAWELCNGSLRRADWLTISEHVGFCSGGHWSEKKKHTNITN